MDYETVSERISFTGMICRGGFHPLPDDRVPLAGETCVLVGNVGRSFWRTFQGGRRAGKNPLEDWTHNVLTRVATDLDAKVLFPFDGPPYLPFQKWARRAEPVYPSPIGPLIHAKYGLWHAYRGMLVFTAKFAVPPLALGHSPCDDCRDKPCLTTCPVDAFEVASYKVRSCTQHISSDQGLDCMVRGCLARRACPVGQEYVYEPEQAEFHMLAFLNSNETTG